MGRRKAGAGSVEVRKGSWELRYHDETGRRRRKSLGRTDEIDLAEARRRADDLLHAIKPGFEGAELTVARLVDELEPVMRSYLAPLTVRARLFACRVAARYFGCRPARAIDVPTAQDFMATIATKAANTRRQYRMHLLGLWKLAHERGLLGPVNPWRSVRVPRAVEPSIREMRPEDVEQLAPHFVFRGDTKDRRFAAAVSDLLRFLCETGLRRGEAERLRWDDVRNGRVMVRETKGGRPRSVPLSSAALAIVASIRLRARGRGLVFDGVLGGNAAYERIRHALSRACRKADLPRMGLHGARHGFLCRLAEAGCTERDIAAVAGHKNDKTTRRYTLHGHPDAAADRAVRRLDAHRAASVRKAE